MKYIVREQELDIFFESRKDPVFCDFIARLLTRRNIEQLINFSTICSSVIQDIEGIKRKACAFSFSIGPFGPIIRHLFDEIEIGDNPDENYEELYQDSKSEKWTEIEQNVFDKLLQEYIDANDNQDEEDEIEYEEDDDENITITIPEKGNIDEIITGKPVAYLLESIGDIYKFRLQTGSLVKSGDKYLLIHPECNILNEFFKTAKRNIEREEIILSDITKLYKKENVR